jgi:hypothetical protein
MVRWRFNETTKNGKEHDHSAPPVYLSHIEQAIQALAKTGDSRGHVAQVCHPHLLGKRLGTLQMSLVLAKDGLV